MLKSLIRPVIKPFWRKYQTWRRSRCVNRFHTIFYDGYEQVKPDNTLTWFGVNSWKCPFDLWIYQEILYATRPEVIVECGVNFGGTTLYLAHLCDLLGTGRVIGCDITLERVHSAVRAHPRVELCEGSSTSPEVVNGIRQQCAGKRTMVILDSDHREEHVREELRCYSPMVTPGCYLICEDTNINGHPVSRRFGPGPFEAVTKFLSDNRGWSVDQNCERLLLTYNPRGYLLRDA